MDMLVKTISSEINYWGVVTNSHHLNLFISKISSSSPADAFHAIIASAIHLDSLNKNGNSSSIIPSKQVDMFANYK